MAITKRNPALSVVLTIITCGLYQWYWIYKISDDLNQLEGSSGSAAMDLIVNILTCDVFLIFCVYKWGKQINYTKKSYGMETDADQSTLFTILFMVLAVFGLGFISMCFIQTNINEILDRITAPAPPHGSQY